MNLLKYTGKILGITIIPLVLTHCGEKPKDDHHEAENQTTEEVSPDVSIFFIPNSRIQDDMLMGRFLDNTIYWTNLWNNSSIGPSIVSTRSGHALEIQGIQNNPDDKNGTVLTLYRQYTIPTNAKQVEVILDGALVYNIWGDKHPHNNLTQIHYFFTKDGQQAGSQQMGFERNQPVKTITKQSSIPPGAQKLMLKIEVDNANILQITNMAVRFGH